MTFQLIEWLAYFLVTALSGLALFKFFTGLALIKPISSVRMYLLGGIYLTVIFLVAVKIVPTMTSMWQLIALADLAMFLSFAIVALFSRIIGK